MNWRLETNERKSRVVGCGPEFGGDCVGTDGGAGRLVEEEDEEMVLDLCFLKSTGVNTTGDS